MQKGDLVEPIPDGGFPNKLNLSWKTYRYALIIESFNNAIKVIWPDGRVDAGLAKDFRLISRYKESE